MQAQLKYIEVDGIRLAYEEFGKGEAVLFLHGFGASSHSWRKVAELLAKSGDRRTICLNLMGFGHSDKPQNTDYSINNQALVVIRFIEKLNLKELTLVGHSYGGGISLIILHELSRQKCEPKIKNLVLASSPCFPMVMPRFLKLLAIPILPHLFLRLIPAEKIVYQMIRYDLPDLHQNSPTVKEYADCMKSNGCHRAMVEMARGIVPKNMDLLTQWYPSIKVPSLLIWGEHDGLIPVTHAKRLQKAIPGSSLVILENCGHIPQERFPLEVHAHLHEFLDL